MSKLYREYFNSLNPWEQNRLMDTKAMRQESLVKEQEVVVCERCEAEPPAKGDFICWTCINEMLMKMEEEDND